METVICKNSGCKLVCLSRTGVSEFVECLRWHHLPSWHLLQALALQESLLMDCSLSLPDHSLNSVTSLWTASNTQPCPQGLAAFKQQNWDRPNINAIRNNYFAHKQTQSAKPDSSQLVLLTAATGCWLYHCLPAVCAWMTRQ